MRTLHSLKCLTALALFAALPALAGSVTDLITIDTSSVNSTAGFIDLEFNPGNGSSQLATAVVTNFNVTGGALDNSTLSTAGDVSGTLPGAVTFMNDTSYNDYFEGIDYGTSVSFDVTLSGPAITSPNGMATAGSTFGVGFYDSGMNSILTNDPSGFAAEVNINLDGSTTALALPNASGGPSVATITPEPSTFWCLFAAAGILSIVRFRRATLSLGQRAARPHREPRQNLSFRR